MHNNIKQIKIKYILKFLNNYYVDRHSGCWIWNNKYHDNGGYGFISVIINKKSTYLRAHRLSYMIYYDEIPKGMIICHICDNKLCVNPHHLFAGTHSDNMKDFANKNKIKGKKHRSSKISENIVKEILLEYFMEGLSTYKISKSKKVQQTQISRIVRGKHWKDVYDKFMLENKHHLPVVIRKPGPKKGLQLKLF